MSVYVEDGKEAAVPVTQVEVVKSVPVVEVPLTEESTPLDHIIAFLQKLGAYLTDVRTVAMIVTIFMGLKAVGAVETEVDEAKVSAAVATVAAVVLALAHLAAVLVPVWKYIDSVTNRPSRGLGPWLDAIKLKKAVKKAAAAKG